MSNPIRYPGLVWVKDPVNPTTGELTGAPPPARHHDDCSHWYRDDRGRLIGEPPYRASDEQMRTLPHCATCAEASTGSRRSRDDAVHEATAKCPVCHQVRSLSGACGCD